MGVFFGQVNLAIVLGELGLASAQDYPVPPLGFYLFGRYRSEAAGLLIGVATAAGFAGLETMGYGFVALLQSRGNLAVLNEVLILRGLTSPAGHLAWTGLVTAALWRERLRTGRPTVGARVLGAFASAVVLHALWDTFAGARSATAVGFLGVELVSLLIAIVSLVLLSRTAREARRAEGSPGRRAS